MIEEPPTIHEIIKLLNDDDVLELFKGTLMQALQGTESFGQTDDEARVSGHQATGMRPLTATISCPTWVRVSMPCRNQSLRRRLRSDGNQHLTETSRCRKSKFRSASVKKSFLFSKMMEETIEAVRFIPHDNLQKRAVDKIRVAVPVARIRDKTEKPPSSFHKTKFKLFFLNVSVRIEEQVDVPVPEFSKQNIVLPVPWIRKQIGR